jgi:hypothetical protein
MRRLLALLAALGLMAGLGCHHNTCELGDLCTSCCPNSGVYALPAGAAPAGAAAGAPASKMAPPKAEDIQKLPMPKDGGAVPMAPPEAEDTGLPPISDLQSGSP